MGNAVITVYNPIKRGQSLSIRDPLIYQSWSRLLRTDWNFSDWTRTCGQDIGNLLLHWSLWDLARDAKRDRRLYQPDENLVYSWIRGQDFAAEIAFNRLTDAARQGRFGLYRKTWGDLLLRIIMNDIKTISIQHNYETLISLQDMERETLHADAMIAMGFVPYAHTRHWGEEWNDHTLSDYLESLTTMTTCIRPPLIYPSSRQKVQDFGNAWNS